MPSFDFNRIPVWLRRTPEQQAQDEALQLQLRQVYGRVHLSPTEKYLMRADMIERSARAHLDHLSTLPDPPEHHLNSAKAQLAEAWAMKGRYRDAAELHPSPEHAARFTLIADAIDVDDSAVCVENCQPERVPHPVTGKTITVHHENVDEIVYSRKHGQLMPLIRCHGCGFHNVKHASANLQHRIDNIGTKEN